LIIILFGFGRKACTLEAKLCPDGKTYVGRTGPNCEFAACPTSAGGQIDRTNSQEGLKEVSRLLKMGDIESAKKFLKVITDLTNSTN